MRNDTLKVIDEFKIKTFGFKKQIEQVETLLNPDEKVRFVTSSNFSVQIIANGKIQKYPGVVMLTNKRLIFNYKVMLNVMNDIIPVDEIRSIDCTGNALTLGHIKVHSVSKMYDISCTNKKDILYAIQNRFEETIENAKNQSNVSSASVPSVDIAGQIEKLAQLKPAK